MFVSALRVPPSYNGNVLNETLKNTTDYILRFYLKQITVKKTLDTYLITNK